MTDEYAVGTWVHHEEHGYGRVDVVLGCLLGVAFEVRTSVEDPNGLTAVWKHEVAAKVDEKAASCEDLWRTQALKAEEALRASENRVTALESHVENWKLTARSAEAEVERLRAQLEEAYEDLTYWQDASDWDDEAFDKLADSLEYWQERSSQHWELLKRSAREALQDRRVRADRDKYYRQALRQAWQAASDLDAQLDERE